MKAAILGMGRMGQIHKRVYERCGVEVVATFDPKEDSWDTKRREVGYGIIQEKICQSDIVSICSPDDVHAAQICQALDSNKHVFCEKPLCHTMREFQAIKAAYEPKAGKCALGMNFPLRWHKPFVDAQHAILRGDIGQIKAIQAEYRYGRIHKITEGWRGKIADYSFVMGGGIHLLDVMQWIGEPVIYGNTSRAIKDVSATSGGLERGGVFTLTCDFATPGPHARRMRIAGSKDDIFIDDQDPTDKERPLTEFLRCLKLRPENGDNYSREFVDAIEDLPSPSQIFRVHEIGLSL